MEVATSVPEWIQARNKEVRRQRKQRVANIFQGAAHWHRASIDGVNVLRLSVTPDKNVAVPYSFAVVESPAPDWAETTAPQSLPYSFEWQQSLVGRFDFFFDLPAVVQCLGLGERFSNLNLRGKVHTLITTDNPHHNEAADGLYKSIPFLILNNGGKCVGVFLDSPAVQRWDLDSDLSESAGVELLTRRGWRAYFIGEGTLPEVVAAFTTLTGRHALPPLWSLGHQQSRWSYPDEATIRHIANEYRTRQIPCDTIVLDIDYMDEYRVFTYSKERFPHFPSLAKEMAARSFKLITIVDPGVKQDPKYPLYQEAIAEKLICYKPDGTPFLEKVWPGVCVFPDFLNPETRSWWGKKHEFYVQNGIAGIWNDMNEPAFFELREVMDKDAQEAPPMQEDRFTQLTPEGRVGHLEVRNLYGMQMSRATHDGLMALRPKERPFVLTRSGFAGLQRYTAVWLGDNMSWFEHLRKSIPMMLNVGLSGVAFAGVDIGGFGGSSDAELLVRWYEAGIFYPFCRNHCALHGAAQEPWAFGPVAEAHCKRLIETRYKLLPLIQTLFWEHARTGAPLMRPLSWHFPSDEIARDIDDQFMFGSSIMVAPVLDRAHNQRSVYFPEGRWYSFEDRTVYEGGRVQSVKMPLGTVPAFVREGAIIPLASVVQSTDDYATTDIEFHVFGPTAEGIVILDDGKTFDYKTGAYREITMRYDGNSFKTELAHDGYTPKHKLFTVINGSRDNLSS